MKKQMRIGLFSLLLVTILSAYVIVAISMQSDNTQTPAILETVAPQAVSVQSTANRTTHNTQYVLESYDERTQTLTEETLPITAEYIGLTRSQLYAKIKEKNADLSLDELEEGLTEYQLISYSPEKIIVRKVYDSAQAGTSYYLLSEDGAITVYYRDRKTIFEYTGIMTEHLPADIQTKVLHGMEIKDEAELYDFLETYSS